MLSMLKHMTRAAEPSNVKTTFVTSVMMALRDAFCVALGAFVWSDCFPSANRLKESVLRSFPFRMPFLPQSEIGIFFSFITLGFVFFVFLRVEAVPFSLRFPVVGRICAESSTSFFNVPCVMQPFSFFRVCGDFFGIFLTPFSLVFGSV